MALAKLSVYRVIIKIESRQMKMLKVFLIVSSFYLQLNLKLNQKVLSSSMGKRQALKFHWKRLSTVDHSTIIMIKYPAMLLQYLNLMLEVHILHIKHLFLVQLP